MTHAGMLWGRGAYNNGGYPTKNTRFGESYNRNDGCRNRSRRLRSPRPKRSAPRAYSRARSSSFAGKLRSPATFFACSKRGGRKKKPKSVIPLAKKIPASPTTNSATAAFGTGLRTDPVFLGLQKTRLLDPVHVASGHERSSRRLSRQRVHGVFTSFTPTTAILYTLALMRRLDIRASAPLLIRRFPE